MPGDCGITNHDVVDAAAKTQQDTSLSLLNLLDLKDHLRYLLYNAWNFVVGEAESIKPDVRTYLDPHHWMRRRRMLKLLNFGNISQ